MSQAYNIWGRVSILVIHFRLVAFLGMGAYIKQVIKFLTTILVVFSFISIAVFGFAAMAHGAGHGPCFAAILGGKPPCPVEDPLGYANFHANFFKKFSTAVFTDSISTFIFSAVFLLIFTLSSFAPAALFSEDFALPFLLGTRILPEKSAKAKILGWLSFHEQSPNFSFRRG